MKKGRVIVLEGACDGIGKTTQYEMLYQKLLKDGEEVVKHHFPSYGTEQGVLVEKYLKGEFGKPGELSPYFVNNLYASDRAVTWNTSLKQAYEEGKTILLDRYTTSSLIYQTALLEKQEEKIRFIEDVIDFEYHKLGIKEPDEVIFLYAPFDLVTKMRNARSENEGVQHDIHEENEDFMRKVYANAMFLADYFAWDKVQCNDGDKMKSISEIHEEIYKLVKVKK